MIFRFQPLLIIGCFLVSTVLQVHTQESIFNILPGDECPAIKVYGETKLYVGDDLFDLINGGAELYHEYGFVEVLAASIVVQDTPLKAEIFDMGSTEAAWGIFGMTASNNAVAFSTGDTARKGEGFLQFIKGSYMVYLYYDQIEETELVQTAECIAANIKGSSDLPEFMQVVDARKEKPENIIFFRGNLGLSGIYNFHYKDVFGYSRGAAAIYPDLKVILLDYDDFESCIDHYNTARDFFIKNTKYHVQHSDRGLFHMTDKKAQQIDCYFENTFVLIFIYSGEMEVNEMREEIVDKMEAH
jgi:hypothetical protein